jgi:hypothetical protein
MGNGMRANVGTDHLKLVYNNSVSNNIKGYTLMTEQVGIKAFAEACDRFRLFSEQVLISTQYCKSFITGVHHPQMNFVYGIRADNMEGLNEDFSKLTLSGIPMLVLCESETTDALNDFFKDNSLTFLGTAQCKILTLENFSYIPSNKIKINEVSTPKMLDTWRSIAAQGFDYPKDVDEKMFKNFYQSGEHHKFVKLFLAYVNNIAVGQSMLVLGDTLSVNMWGSVLPEYRKQGILTEMICYRLHLAKKLGFKSNIVQCMPMSASVYDKNGYQNSESLNLYRIDEK